MRKGQSIIELLIVFGLMTITLPAIFAGLMSSREGRVNLQQRVKATALMEEGYEAARTVRETGWNTFAVNGTYHPQQSASNWTLASGSETVGSFTRSIVISDAQRDASGAIVASGGTADPSTKRVVVTVSWGSPVASSVSKTVYLTRHDNLAYTQTTVADFTAGTHTNTTTTNTAGGEVTLGAGGSGSWCNPLTNIVAQFDLPKNGVANAISAYEGRAVAGTGDNSSGVSFADLSVSNANPPAVTENATFNGYKTNDVFVETTYGYIATDTNDKEIVILSMTGSSISEAGHFNASGSTDADSVYVSGTVGYMTQGSTFRTFDLSSKTGSRPQLGSRTLAGSGTSIMVVGNYAYVSIAGSATELQILNISNPSSPTVVASADVNGQAAQDVHVNATGTRAYLATSASSTQREFFIIDVSTKTGSRPTVGSYEATGMSPNATVVVPGNIALLAGTGGEEYQVINIATESSPTRCGGMEMGSGIQDIAGILESDGDVYSYILTGDASLELKVIEGGPGGTFATSGTFTSDTFDAGFSTAFNRISFNSIEPVNTDVTLQVAIADAVSGSCAGATYTYVGPDGTGSTYFTTDSPIATNDDGSGYENPGRCFRYRANLSTTDSASAPILQDVTINYSP